MTYTIRPRKRTESSPQRGLKSSWVEWQVVQGRRVVYRADTEAQAKEWIAQQTDSPSNE